MAYVHIQSGQYKWYPESEYSDWEKIKKPVDENKTISLPEDYANATKEGELSETGEVINVKIKKPKKNDKAN